MQHGEIWCHHDIKVDTCSSGLKEKGAFIPDGSKVMAFFRCVNFNSIFLFFIYGVLLLTLRASYMYLEKNIIVFGEYSFISKC